MTPPFDPAAALDIGQDVAPGRSRIPLGMTAPDLGHWPFAGRSGELAALAELSEDRRTDTVLVSGAEGVGKSRLADEYLALCGAQGCRGERVVARREKSAVPFGATAHLLPPDADPADPVSCFAHAARGLRTADGRRLVVVDDVHWLDPASAILLRQLLDAGLVRVVATARAGLRGSKPSDALVHAGEVSWLELPSFTESSVEEVLEAVLGHHVGKGCVRHLFTLSGGNARALREQVLSALDRGQLVRRDGVWDLDRRRSGNLVFGPWQGADGRGADAAADGTGEAAPDGTDPGLQGGAAVLALTEAGRLEEARALGHAAFERVVDGGPPDFRRWTAVLLGRLEWLAGRVLDARRWFTEALSGTGPAKDSGVRRIALGGAAACLAATGDVAAARAMLTRLGSTWHDPDAGLLPGAEEALGRAWAAAAEGRGAAARHSLIAAAARARVANHLASEAMLLTEAARLGGAREVLAPIDLNAGRCGGRLATARQTFVHALASEEPQALIASGDDLRGMGAAALAAEAYTAASSSLHDSGRVREATSAAHLAAAVRASCQGLSTPLLGGAAPTQSLTVREREVARLAARGTTSKDIAAHLFLSPRTVDNHLQRVYQKLGVSSRQELQRLLEP
ncbi:helix-turn-helix transcriptional regulator [Actinacidiphila bryophytorum]|uniref:ATP/maltotriose-dependent transcriptional regulator MalT n=1 Tax=Actinacidiphila bryophytorum TaxID=1436133 RepID=A0A9W4GXZ3_9ACTN|nr:LuxR family transcriptional regulator [Actinacidiphila bryophytorum]MBM9434401.1 helix-turn-helix domain-containing protein [Actinacidiphila bryophytorum]MBN6544430.1 helix-turn-helix domain-containing protein [Actinacidiphila bryophytorum]CAG7625620.1 putative ATP/maltotriose-dependent transcriptional regulator MalT [Actinacidiphila bryophytorum]